MTDSVAPPSVRKLIPCPPGLIALAVVAFARPGAYAVTAHGDLLDAIEPQVLIGK